MGKKHKRDAKRGKLPKSIGGVKLSKDLRKAGDALIESARSPGGRQVIAAGLAMAANAASKRARATQSQPPVPPQPAAPAQPPVPPFPPQAPGQPGVPPDVAQMVEAFSAATTAFLDGFFGRRR